MAYAGGDRYEGSWAAGKRHGRGAAVFASGARFAGAWANDKPRQGDTCPARCRLAGGGLTSAVAGRPAEVRIEARDASGQRRLTGGERFTVRLSPAAGGSGGGGDVPAVAAAVELADARNGCYVLTYTCDVAGAFSLEVLDAGGEPLGGASPSRLVVAPGTAIPARCVVDGAGLRASVAGVEAEFFVAGRDALGNPAPLGEAPPLLAACLRSETLQAEVALGLTALPDGRLRCAYTPSQPGFYLLTLTAAATGRHVCGSPLPVRVAPAAAADASDAESSPPPPALPLDRSAHWARLARDAYAADGDTAGWEPEAPPESEEARFARLHPDVPVIQNLEDLFAADGLMARVQATSGGGAAPSAAPSAPRLPVA
jgi:hypothetical protein